MTGREGGGGGGGGAVSGKVHELRLELGTPIVQQDLIFINK